jgi:GDSL-like Lipase/Acylhydrolase family
MILVGLLFGCIVAEAALRIVGYSYPLWYQTDAVRGYAAIPNVEGWFWVENTNYVRINSQGFRDREHTIAKPPNTFRIAIIGDSFAEARQVRAESAFWSVIERELQKTAPAGRQIEVLNFGVGGYGTVEELLTLRQRVWDYSPDLVLLAFCIYNDVTDNYEPFKNAAELPYFKLENDELVLDDSFLRSKKYQRMDSTWFKAWTAVHNGSRLIQLLHHAQFAIRTRLSEWKESRRLAELQKQADAVPGARPPPTNASLTELAGMPNMMYRPPDDDDWRAAWQTTEALIDQMRREVEQHGAQFLLVTITADIQVYPDRSVRQAMIDRLGVIDLFYPDRRLAEFADRQGIPFLDLAAPMQEAADRDHVFFHGFGGEIGNGHWNEAGHKFAGELMASKIAGMISN